MPVAGFYYGLAASADVGTVDDDAKVTTWQLGDGTSMPLTATKPSDAKGFYQIRVRIAPPINSDPI